MSTDDPAPAPFPPLAEPPADNGGWAVTEPWLRRGFKALNRWCMVPLLRAGLGAWMGTPVGGYMLLLRARGRKSGLIRETPVSYMVAEGSAWVEAGFGPRTEWYRNLRADPRVEVVLRGGRHTAVATEELDPAVRARIVPRLVRATGLPALMIGLNPWSATDEAILDAVAWVPLVRIQPDDGPLEAGPDDPGGRAWIWRQALVLGVAWIACRLVRRGVSRSARGVPCCRRPAPRPARR